jgi:hypothetical protein
MSKMGDYLINVLQKRNENLDEEYQRLEWKRKQRKFQKKK